MFLLSISDITSDFIAGWCLILPSFESGFVIRPYFDDGFMIFPDSYARLGVYWEIRMLLRLVGFYLYLPWL